MVEAYRTDSALYMRLQVVCDGEPESRFVRG